ncbi:MAG TPA: nucleotidyltransferase family protein [Candidatus Sulfotelmatobacter sp.]|nr:nucleotidyltransferase family protein [Candidatus Sulfotelmatobacter sp.]
MAHTTTALETEWSLLRAACSEIIRPLALASQQQASIRWKSVFDLGEYHGVLPILYRRLSSVEGLLSTDEMATLKQRYEANLHKAMLLSLELIRIYDRLSESGIEVLPYKGLALAEAVYGDIALRRAGDIDLLIHPADFPKIREALHEFGYTAHAEIPAARESAYLKSGYECAFDGRRGPNLLEVQWALQPRFYAVDFDMGGLFRRAVTISVAGRAMQTPSMEDLFIILSLHAAKHVWGRLIWLCDLARIMNLPTLNWTLIADQATHLGIVRIVRVGMLLANRILAAPIPSAAETKLPQDAAAEALADDIQPHVTAESLFDVESLDYFRFMLRLRERNSDRLRFLSRLIFTPGPGEWEAVRLPATLSPIYRLVRLSRLTARMLRA